MRHVPGWLSKDKNVIIDRSLQVHEIPIFVTWLLPGAASALMSWSASNSPLEIVCCSDISVSPIHN
jgi:hypothetical protein